MPPAALPLTLAVRRATMLVKSRCCALYLTMFTWREAMLFEHCKYRRMRTLPRQCILVQVREKRARRPPGRETDGSSSPSSFPSSSSSSSFHPLIFLTLLFALAARNNSIDQYVSPERSDPRKQCYTWHCFVYPILLYRFSMHVPRKELSWTKIEMRLETIFRFSREKIAT